MTAALHKPERHMADPSPPFMYQQHTHNVACTPLLSPFLCTMSSVQGCGLVVFAQHSEAAAALEALNGRVIWPGARSPMVIVSHTGLE
jgi:hypothetical protein